MTSLEIALAWLQAQWIDVVIVWITLAVSYVIFGIAGFGAVLLAAPVLAHRMPLAAIVPLLAVLDVNAAVVNSVKLSEKVDWRELLWLVPWMIVGSIAGVTMLVSLPANITVFALGVFITAYAVYGLWGAPAIRGHLGRMWSFPFGLVGGLLSGMFGTGGFLYVIYLSLRLAEKDAIRATMSMLIGLAATTRLSLFVAAGVYADLKLLLLAAVSFPAMLIGIFLGHRITLRLTHAQFMRFLYLVLIGTGLSLVLRTLT
jgi:uncharacterized membrane protein YfcA